MKRTAAELGWGLVIALVLVAAAAAAYFWLPDAIITAEDLNEKVADPPKGADPAPTPNGVDLVTARNGARTAAVALVAALGAAIATYFAARTYYLSRGGQHAERHAKGAEQLANAAVAVRLSAIRRLERLVRESPGDRQAVVDTLAAFLRHPPVTHAPSGGRARADIQEAFAAADRLRRIDPDSVTLNLAGADLRGVDVAKAALRRADLSEARLEGASLPNADLSDANLTNARAQSAWLANADLTSARLIGAQLQDATLERVAARGAQFDDATLLDTSLKGARLRGSTGLRAIAGGIDGATADKPAELP
ncbi:MAG TPA: pentapeptide repeat-containing protein [Actinomycetota bacterium]|nr:pentapeptide repeat-containing protein [Actinomycetota bacterium]